jgi:hypothetical protein
MPTVGEKKGQVERERVVSRWNLGSSLCALQCSLSLSAIVTQG